MNIRRIELEVGGSRYKTSHQHTVEPQVHVVVLAEPGSIVVEAVAGEEYHQVVGQGDEDEDGQSRGHQADRDDNVFHYM